MPAHLFTRYFLVDGIRATSEWVSSVDRPEAFTTFRTALSYVFEAFSAYNAPNEATTEQDLIRPIFELLGWTDYLPQQSSTHNEDIPDHLLFSDPESKEKAVARPNPDARFQDALLVQESKRFGLALDSRNTDGKHRSRTPHGQILQYLSTAESRTDGDLHWGVLTNGGVWRLYDYRARPRSTAYFEADLGEILGSGDEDGLRVFYLLFRRDSFILRDGANATFLDAALNEGRRYEEKVAQDLSSVVFTKIFRHLVEVLADASGESLSSVRHAALIFLYRLLFVLYAEDRGLLPVNDSRYDDYGLRKRVRDDAARRIQDRDTFSTVASIYYDQLNTLFRLIDQGDASIGLPPYNGGLFSAGAAPLLNTVRLPDAFIAPIIYDLSHAETAEGPRFVNYRDMSVQQLGSIYERLLEQEPVRDADGKIVIRPNPYARKDSGSFFTPQELVDLIVDRTLKPLAEERLKAFEDKSKELKSSRRPIADRRTELLALDPAEAVLELKVLDPAMGSGHFLVTAVDFLSDYIAERIENVPAVQDWLGEEYVSPLVERIAAIRYDILQRARASDWVIDESLLTDQAIIRRMVLKRCIYGVDKNPLTVELAKVSLWLHSFTVGAPLSFLDHHLRCGDSLIGMKVQDSIEELRRLSGLFASSAIQAAENATEGMQRIEEMSDADVAEVRQSAALFKDVENTTEEMRGLLDFLCSLRWLTAGMKKKERTKFESPLLDFLTQNSQNAYKLLALGTGAVDDVKPGNQETSAAEFETLWHDARSIADRERFLHWEVAFPGVWHDWQDIHPKGGFDAIIGNPPWDRIEQQEVEWFAIRDNEVALATTGAMRKALISRRVEEGNELALEYEKVRKIGATMRALARSYGDYPLLSGGRINLYSLFVERAMSLVKPDGFVGLLTPSGIYADKTASEFFKSVSTSGRVSGLLDFENRRIGTGLSPYFSDVDSRFKFCALILGGAERRFTKTDCAFFLSDTETIKDPDRCFPLTPADFALVNPNTGTAPVFRTRRDAEITRRIYARHPVLVDRSDGSEHPAWPIRYAQGLFNMTADSHLFRTAKQLELAGFYPVEGNRWKRGKELYLPLYQGRMIHQFDHRVSSVRVNPESTHNPYLSEAVTEAQHADPAFLPQPQYWVPANAVDEGVTNDRQYWLAFRDIARPTDARTMIVSLIPPVGAGNKVPLLIPYDNECDINIASCLVANLNSLPFDYFVRQKIQGTSMNWFIVEQLPVIEPNDYDRRFGNTTARELVRDHVLRLTYTAHDMTPFARDLGYNGPPFIWDEEERRHLRGRLDALYFRLYGLSREDAGYILSTFPIVRREDEAAFGTYRTRDLVLAYMSALSAGDTETVVNL